MLMTPRQWMTTLGLLGLVLLAAIGLIVTRDSAPPATQSSTPGHHPPLVDEQPLRTARAVATLAADRDEQRSALQAVKLADHEVDLAFADGLRDAAENPATPTPQTRELTAQENSADAAIKTDQGRIDQLKKQIAAASGTHRDHLQQQLDFALVQLELDQDELEEAKDTLLRSAADPLSRIQRQFNRHEANEHALDPASLQPAGSHPEVNYLAHNLWTQFAAWRALRNKRIKLQQALMEATGDAAILSQNHTALDKKLQVEAPGNLAIRQPAANQTSSTSAQPPATSPSAQPVGSASAPSGTISSLHHLSVTQKDRVDLNQRIQDHQEIADLYSNWNDRVESHERAAMHGMIRSALLIVLILLVLYLAGRLVDHFLTDITQERTRLLTLRVVTHFAVRAVGLLMILLVLFGTPSQMPTLIGLAGAGAGLTVALKDFITAFFGWFVLMGRNGIRVGDWVEINDVVGEVVEINLLRTILLETGNWADTGHPTGRKVAFVNSFAIVGHYFNFSTGGQWLWDEIEITVPSDQDPYPLIAAIQEMVAHETEAHAQAAEEEWKRASSSHHAQSVSATPAIDLRPTAAGIEVHVRYITQAHDRYATRARLNHALVELLRRRAADRGKTVRAGETN
jgi:small-conductance mechanosensitive channel